jgi:hypothetical protein
MSGQIILTAFNRSTHGARELSCGSALHIQALTFPHALVHDTRFRRRSQARRQSFSKNDLTRLRVNVPREQIAKSNLLCCYQVRQRVNNEPLDGTLQVARTVSEIGSFIQQQFLNPISAIMTVSSVFLVLNAG